MANHFETLWNEPRAPGAPQRVWRDWVLVAVLVPVAIGEGLLSESAVWRPLSIAVTLIVVLTLLWRRTHPLGMVTVAFGTTAVVNAVAILNGIDWTGLSTGASVLLLPYALLRWGSGRESMLGLAVIGLSFTIGMWRNESEVGEVLGASLFVLFPAALGASVRYQNSAHRRAIDQVRLREREQLARELHDTVAHHVSAIAVQAQAGRTLAESRPLASLDALAIIEEAASRTLSEMRRMVGALRDGDSESSRSPIATLADIERLADDGASPQVDVVLTGSLEELHPTLQSTLYRLAQEAITNARRHARAATRIVVRVEGEAENVRLRVVDDGEAADPDAAPGFGLRGMGERVSLLGGTLRAGPGGRRGWVVEAVLPRRGSGS